MGGGGGGYSVAFAGRHPIIVGDNFQGPGQGKQYLANHSTINICGTRLTNRKGELYTPQPNFRKVDRKAKKNRFSFRGNINSSNG
jgi:hypothetical protein